MYVLATAIKISFIYPILAVHYFCKSRLHGHINCHLEGQTYKIN